MIPFRCGYHRCLPLVWEGHHQQTFAGRLNNRAEETGCFTVVGTWHRCWFESVSLALAKNSGLPINTLSERKIPPRSGSIACCPETRTWRNILWSQRRSTVMLVRPLSDQFVVEELNRELNEVYQFTGCLAGCSGALVDNVFTLPER